jgi:RimJ/RimL family protein N-acetyltransferase
VQLRWAHRPGGLCSGVATSQIKFDGENQCSSCSNDAQWRLDDAESVARHANNRKIWLAVRDLFPHPYTIRDAHEFLHRAISEQPEMKFCVEIEDAAVGGIGVHPGQDVYRHTATVGYWLGEQFWGRGVMLNR